MEKEKVDDPAFIPECEVFEEGEGDARRASQSCECQDKFIAVDKFTINDIPQYYHTSEHTMDSIKELCDRTVRVKVKYTSPNRPDTYPDSTAPYPYAKYKGSIKVVRCGTGFIYDKVPPIQTNEQCPCPDCQKSGNPKMEYFKVKISTASHVVFDDSEAQKTECTVFYDFENTEGVKYLYGVKGVSRINRGFYDYYDIGSSNFTERCDSDWFIMECVSHDIEFYDLLKFRLNIDRMFRSLMSPLPVIVSHPHGFTKKISVGTYRYYAIQLSHSHSFHNPYVIPTLTNAKTTLDVLSKYPGFFEKRQDAENWYYLSRPLNLNIRCDTTQMTELCCYTEYGSGVFLPKDSLLTSIDGKHEFPVESFQFSIYSLLHIFDDNLVSCHLLYDTPTCNGSSGALVTSRPISHQFLPCHFGKVSPEVNRSGSYKFLAL